MHKTDHGSARSLSLLLLGIVHMCLCVFHIEPVLLSTAPQRSQCPCEFFILARHHIIQALRSQNTRQRYYYTTTPHILHVPPAAGVQV